MRKCLIFVLLLFSFSLLFTTQVNATNIDDIIDYIGILEDKGLLYSGCTANVTNFLNSHSISNNYFIGISAADSTYLPNRLFICSTEGIIIKNPNNGNWKGYNSSNQSKGLSIYYGDLSWTTISSTNARRF